MHHAPAIAESSRIIEAASTTSAMTYLVSPFSSDLFDWRAEQLLI